MLVVDGEGGYTCARWGIKITLIFAYYQTKVKIAAKWNRH